MAAITKGINDKQRIFIAEYVACLNGAEAARRAGYAQPSARVVASKMLSTPAIRKEVDRLIRKRLKMIPEEIIGRLEEQAKSDISTFLKPGLLEVDPEQVHKHGHLIESILQTEFGLRLTLYSSQAALKLLGQTRALFVERTIAESLDGLEIVDSEDRGKNPSHKGAKALPAPEDD